MMDTVPMLKACMNTHRNPALVPSLTGYVHSTLVSKATGRMANATSPACISEPDPIDRR